MEISNIHKALAEAPLDKAANVKIIKLTGDEKISVFAAEISPHTALNPHYHKHGIETYQIFEGEGLMKTGSVEGKSVNWKNSFQVAAGDFFTIAEGEVHQILNESDEKLIALFTAPAAHLGKDRFFVEVQRA